MVAAIPRHTNSLMEVSWFDQYLSGSRCLTWAMTF